MPREGSCRCGGSRQKAVYLTRGGPESDFGESAATIVADAIGIGEGSKIKRPERVCGSRIEKAVNPKWRVKEPRIGQKPKVSSDNYSLRELIPAGKLGQNEEGKMGELLAQVLEPDNLKRAIKRVVKNGGAAGTDGMQVKDLQSYLDEAWPNVKDQIERGQYHPLPVLGIEIPKESGGTRQLGIPTVVDRMIQQAIHQVRSPICIHLLANALLYSSPDIRSSYIFSLLLGFILA